MKLSKNQLKRILDILTRSIPLAPIPRYLADILRELKQGDASINYKINQASRSMRETSQLIEDLQTDVTRRTEKVKELKKEYEKYSKLAAIEEEKIKPLMDQLEDTLSKGKFSKWINSFFNNFAASALMFFVGIWISPYVREWNVFKQDSSNRIEETITKPSLNLSDELKEQEKKEE